MRVWSLLSWIVSLTVLHAPYTGLGHTHSRIKTATFLFVTFYIIRRPSIENQHATFWNEYALTFSACNEWWQSPNSADIASLQTIIEMSLVWTEQVVSTKRKVERSQLRIKYVANVCFFFFQKKKKKGRKKRETGTSFWRCWTLLGDWWIQRGERLVIHHGYCRRRRRRRRRAVSPLASHSSFIISTISPSCFSHSSFILFPICTFIRSRLQQASAIHKNGRRSREHIISSVKCVAQCNSASSSLTSF